MNVSIILDGSLDNINSLIEDHEGNLWISTYSDGIFTFLGEKFVTYNQTVGLKNNIVLSVAKSISLSASLPITKLVFVIEVNTV